MVETNALLTLRARSALGMSQRELANLLGISERTVQRWDSKRSAPYPQDMARLAVAVHPHDAELAERIAQRSGQTLEQLGIHAAPAAAPAPPRIPTGLIGPLVDAVVCASADVLGVPPSAARPALLAALQKAAALELTAEDIVSVLAASGAKRARARSPSSG